LRAFFTSFQIIRENILPSENQKKNTVQKNSLYYTEKNSSFVDVFSERFTNYFYAKRGLPKL